MISRVLSTSKKRAALHQVVPGLAEFCQQLYPLLVAHADDFGRLSGDSFTVKHAVDPTSPRPLKDFESGLQALHEVGLVIRYESDGRQCLQITKFDPHQIGLHKRTSSDFPAPAHVDDDGGLDASEARVEERFAADLQAGVLRVGDFTVTAVERQVRKGASYLDLVAQTTINTQLLIEVKRQRITLNAISQVRAYRALLVEPVIPIVLGHGVVGDLQLPVSDVVLGTYDDTLRIETVNTITVNSHSISLNHIPSEQKRTEQNLTEGNKTKNVSLEPRGGSKPAAPRRSAQTGLALSPVVLEFPTIGADGDVYRLSEAQVAEWAKLFPGLDVLAECRHALAWVRENTGHRKTAGGMGRFLVGWFTRSVNRRGAGSGVSSRLDSNGLSQRSNDVLRGLGRRS